MTDLFVYFQEILIGTLRKNPDATLGFQYANKWRHHAKAFALSPYLDLNETGVFDNRKTRAFFENLLPEGKVRERLEKLRGKSLSSGFQFLQEYGSDCAGAFVISPKRSSPANGIQNEFTELNLTELAVAHQNNHNLMTHVIENHGGRFSLAGAQDKIPIVYYEGQVYIPTAGAATTHILKPPHLGTAAKYSVYNEYFCMRLAKACRLDVPEVFIAQAEIPFYITERYDRHVVGENISRIHQIDFCQAQNYLVEEKYEEDGGPSLATNYACLLVNSSNGIKDVRRYIDWICFNLIIGNNDCHSKNISFIVEGDHLVLAPFYDLLCTSIYREYSPEFAFNIGRNRAWGKLQKKDLENEVIKWGLSKSPDLLVQAMAKMQRNIEAHLDQQVAEFEHQFPQVRAASRIQGEIHRRLKSFAKRGF